MGSHVCIYATLSSFDCLLLILRLQKCFLSILCQLVSKGMLKNVAKSKFKVSACISQLKISLRVMTTTGYRKEIKLIFRSLLKIPKLHRSKVLAWANMSLLVFYIYTFLRIKNVRVSVSDWFNAWTRNCFQWISRHGHYQNSEV